MLIFCFSSLPFPVLSTSCSEFVFSGEFSCSLNVAFSFVVSCNPSCFSSISPSTCWECSLAVSCVFNWLFSFVSSIPCLSSFFPLSVTCPIFDWTSDTVSAASTLVEWMVKDKLNPIKTEPAPNVYFLIENLCFPVCFPINITFS